METDTDAHAVSPQETLHLTKVCLLHFITQAVLLVVEQHCLIKKLTGVKCSTILLKKKRT